MCTCGGWPKDVKGLVRIKDYPRPINGILVAMTYGFFHALSVQRVCQFHVFLGHQRI